MDVVAQASGFEFGFQFADDLRRSMGAVAQLENFRRALIQLDHAFRVKNDEFLLRFFPLQAVQGGELQGLVGLDGHGFLFLSAMELSRFDVFKDYGHGNRDVQAIELARIFASVVVQQPVVVGGAAEAFDATGVDVDDQVFRQ